MYFASPTKSRRQCCRSDSAKAPNRSIGESIGDIPNIPVKGRYNALMPTPEPRPLTPGEQHARRSRAARIAQQLGFVGRIEYRHVYSQTGGAQYGRGSTQEADLLTVYAEAFERDADPEDF